MANTQQTELVSKHEQTWKDSDKYSAYSDECSEVCNDEYSVEYRSGKQIINRYSEQI
jgi:hypothetical protein